MISCSTHKQSLHAERSAAGLYNDFLRHSLGPTLERGKHQSGAKFSADAPLLSRSNLKGLLDGVKWQHNHRLQSRCAVTLAEACVRLSQHSSEADNKTTLTKILKNLLLYLRPDLETYGRWWFAAEKDVAAQAHNGTMNPKQPRTARKTGLLSAATRQFGGFASAEAQATAVDYIQDSVWQRGAALAFSCLHQALNPNNQQARATTLLEFVCQESASPAMLGTADKFNGLLYIEALQPLAKDHL